MLNSQKTIVAQCTPRGSGALALIRISGEQAIAIADKMSLLERGTKLSIQTTHTVHLGQMVDQHDEMVDQVMFILMRSPKTFTGEDVVEISCHNSQFIVDRIIELAIFHGARSAERGEFTQQAFLNQKIDLSQAEAINSLISAHTEQALKKSLAQLKGSLAEWVYKIEQKLLHCLAFCEASFEFIDEELDFQPQILNELKDIINYIAQAQASHAIERQIREGFRVALIGAVNAGKSSLFNALTKRERAIVTPIAGTTRDVIESAVCQEQFYITFVDTAGLRQTADQIEQIGIEKSLAEAESADVILLVFDSSRELSSAETDVYLDILNRYTAKVISVLNKSDLPFRIKPLEKSANSLKVSQQDQRSIKDLEDHILNKLKTILQQDASPFLLNQRQFNVLRSIKDECQQIVKMLANPQYELISLHLNEILQQIGSVTGKTVSEDTLELIFKQFCVGK